MLGESSRTCLPALAAIVVAGVAAADAAAPSGGDGGGGEVVLRAAWGDGPDEIGRRGGDESAPEGPMSFAVDPSGGVWILDQANRRVVRWGADGRPAETIPIGADTFQDVALGPGGEILVMDRLALGVVRVLSRDGTILADVPLAGDGIPEGGGTTALLADPEGVWVEYEHSRSVRVADAQFRPPFFRGVLRGRPMRVGGARVVGRARIAGPRTVEVWTVDPAADVITAQTTLDFDDPVARIAALGADAKGDVVCVVHLMREDPGRGFAVVFESIEIVVMDSALAERRRIEARPSAGPWEQFRDFEVAPDGSVYQLILLEDGVEMRRWPL